MLEPSACGRSHLGAAFHFFRRRLTGLWLQPLRFDLLSSTLCRAENGDLASSFQRDAKKVAAKKRSLSY
jgi:hypothetical protein